MRLAAHERLHLEGTTEAVPLWACTGWKRPNEPFPYNVLQPGKFVKAFSNDI